MAVHTEEVGSDGKGTTSANLPLVSAVIPAYNSARYVGRAIRSVLQQSYPNLECIVVDDGSTDDTSAVIASFGRSVRHIRQANAGASAARNAGIRAAAGRYIAFLDSDDYWLSTKIELQVPVLASDSGIVLVASGFEWIRANVDPQWIDPSAPGVKPERLEIYDGLEHLILDPYLGTPTVIVDAEAARRVGGFDTSLEVGEDVDFYFRLCAGRRYAILRQSLVRCQLRHGSLTTSARGYACGLQVLDRLARAHPELAVSGADVFRARRRTIYLDWVRHLLLRADGAGARRVLAQGRAEGALSSEPALYLKSWFASPIRRARMLRRRLQAGQVPR